jgi:hypothetical protein
MNARDKYLTESLKIAGKNPLRALARAKQAKLAKQGLAHKAQTTVLKMEMTEDVISALVSAVAEKMYDEETGAMKEFADTVELETAIAEAITEVMDASGEEMVVDETVVEEAASAAVERLDEEDKQLRKKELQLFEHLIETQSEMAAMLVNLDEQVTALAPLTGMADAFKELRGEFKTLQKSVGKFPARTQRSNDDIESIMQSVSAQHKNGASRSSFLGVELEDE